MKGKTILSSVFSGRFLVMLTSTTALSAERLALKAGSDMTGATGEAVISDTGGENKDVVITARGLEPNEVYTVWLVNMKPKMDMAGLGKGDYAFTSDAKGNGRYTATISAAELGKWQLIKIAHHPDRNPRNMRNIGNALKEASSRTSAAKRPISQKEIGLFFFCLPRSGWSGHRDEGLSSTMGLANIHQVFKFREPTLL